MKKVIATLKMGESITIQADVTTDLNNILQYYTPKFSAELKELFPLIEQGLKDGIIPSKIVQRFNTVLGKSEFARGVVKKVVKQVGNPKRDGKREDGGGTGNEIPNFGWKEKFYNLGHVFDGGTYNIDSRPKEFITANEPLLADLTKEYPELGKALAVLLKMAKDFVPVIDIRDKLEDIKTNKTIEKYRPPPAKVASMKGLYAILEKFISDTRTEMIAFWEKNTYDGALRLIKLHAGDTVSYNDFQKYRMMPAIQLLTWDFDNRKSAYSNFQLKNDAKQLALKLATEIADSIKEEFLAKSVNKLAKIVENRGDYESAEKQGLSFHSGSIEGHVLVKFQNGDSFLAYVQVVSVTNQQGTYFTRYPLTFHNVKLGDKQYKMVTEEWMNNNFK